MNTRERKSVRAPIRVANVCCRTFCTHDKVFADHSRSEEFFPRQKYVDGPSSVSEIDEKVGRRRKGESSDERSFRKVQIRLGALAESHLSALVDGGNKSSTDMTRHRIIGCPNPSRRTQRPSDRGPCNVFSASARRIDLLAAAGEKNGAAAVGCRSDVCDVRDLSLLRVDTRSRNARTCP